MREHVITPSWLIQGWVIQHAVSYYSHTLSLVTASDLICQTATSLVNNHFAANMKRSFLVSCVCFDALWSVLYSPMRFTPHLVAPVPCVLFCSRPIHKQNVSTSCHTHCSVLVPEHKRGCDAIYCWHVSVWEWAWEAVVASLPTFIIINGVCVCVCGGAVDRCSCERKKQF